jgi:hypothetical protein
LLIYLVFALASAYPSALSVLEHVVLVFRPVGPHGFERSLRDLVDVNQKLVDPHDIPVALTSRLKVVPHVFIRDFEVLVRLHEISSRRTAREVYS